MKASDPESAAGSPSHRPAAAGTQLRTAGWWNYLAPVTLPHALPTPVYGAMLAIWHLRPMLQRQFPLGNNRSGDYLNLLAWLTHNGRRQYAILREIPDWDAALNQPMALPDLEGDRWGRGFTVGMFLLGVARQRYNISAVLSNVRARHLLAVWYWRGARQQHFMPAPPPWQLAWLRSRHDKPRDFAETLRRPRLDQGKTARQLLDDFGLADVVASWPASPQGVAMPSATALPSPGLRQRMLGSMPRWLTRGLMWVRQGLRALPSPEAIGRVMNLIPRQVRHGSPAQGDFGVNLFGYAKGELGIGEDVRMVSRALKNAGVPFCIINVQPGENVSQMDASTDGWQCHKPRYAINLFCMTGMEQVRFFCEQGTELFRERYTIGLWPWELPAWPQTWSHAFNTVNEIWGISRYTVQAYQDAPVHVHHVPLAVNASPVAHLDRAHFGLPPDSYLFIFAFDLNSTLARKNPEGVVRAFQRAFPRSSGRDVGLVIKVSHANARDAAWRKLRSRILADPRIHLVERMMRRPEVLALYRCCDCFVSLHRAEGFGRGIAEALLLGRQVVCTGFSGNLDYCESHRVRLVSYHTRRLRMAEYFFPHGQVWAEPSVEHAAQLMRETMDNPLPTDHAGFDLGFAATGRAYKERLQEIYSQHAMRGREPRVTATDIPPEFDSERC